MSWLTSRCAAAARPGTATWGTQVRPGLTVDVTLRRRNGGRELRYVVTDAGAPVRSATVRVGGRTLTTTTGGRTAYVVPAGRRGVVTTVVTRSGYTPARVGTNVGRR